ncbi:MAG: trehalase family glycosidase [Deinococcota bacterium]
MSSALPNLTDMPTPALADVDLNALRERAVTTLRDNDVGVFTRPGTHQYPHQWNWDAALVALGLYHIDPERARVEVRGLLAGQWADGLVPHIIYHGGASHYFPQPEFWQTGHLTASPEIPTSGITQPPLLATCLYKMHMRACKKLEATPSPATEMEHASSLAFLREVYPGVLAWHRWLHTTRDPEGDGLAAIIHPWESGTDNAARWIETLARIKPENVPLYDRKDSVHVAGDERPFQGEYERFIYLLDCFRRWRYDPKMLYERSPFLVEDTLFNAVLHRADRDLKAIAVLLGEATDELDTWLEATYVTYNERLWFEHDGRYCPFDLRNTRLLVENDCATFMSLFANLASSQRAKRLIYEHLCNAAAYAPCDPGMGQPTTFWVPSLAKTSLFYEPRRYWRGPAWVLMNWFVAEGLDNYNYHTLAENIRQHTLALVAKSGFTEYYDPRDGSPAGATGFSWSAALTLELLADHAE